MKKLVVFILVSVMALSLAACAQQPAAQEKSPSAEPSTVESAPTTSEEPLEEPADEPVMIKVSMAENQNDNKAVAIAQVTEKITERTEGRVQFEVYYNGELGSIKDTIELMFGGANIIDGTSMGSYASYGSPDMTGPDLMFVLQNPEECNAFGESELFAQMCDELLESSGLRVICMNWANAPRCVMSRVPINSVEDLKGKIIRVPLPAYAAFFTRLGATTANMTMAEVYTGLQNGTIDACEFGFNTLYNNSLYEVAKYVFVSEHTWAPSCWTMSDDVFQKMTPEDQAIFVEEWKAGGDYFTELNVSTNDDYKAKMEAEGVTFVYPSDADKAAMAAASADSFNEFPELSEGLAEKINAAIGK